MIVFQDMLSGQDIGTDSYPSKLLASGAVIAMETKKITIGVDEDAIAKATGANESKEEGGEQLDSDKKQVINIVNAHDLQVMKLEKKEFKTMQNAYWKALKQQMDETKFAALGFKKGYVAPTDKKAAAEAESAAEAKLSKADKAAYAAAVKRLESFKKNFPLLSNFIKSEIEPFFEEFDFYIPGGGAELGKCIIIPARFVGEAVTPTFYYWVDGLIEQKF